MEDKEFYEPTVVEVKVADSWHIGVVLRDHRPEKPELTVAVETPEDVFEQFRAVGIALDRWVIQTKPTRDVRRFERHG